MNKKGFLLGEFTLKVVIAVLCILILVFLVFKIYSTLTTKPDFEQEQATLDRVVERVRLVAGSSVERESYVLLEPRGWSLVYDPKERPQEGCLGLKCLCLCEKENACDKVGVCESIPKNV